MAPSRARRPGFERSPAVKAWPLHRGRVVGGARTDRFPRCCRPLLESLEDRYLLSGGYTLTNLASDVPGLAPVTDPNLVNPWGISFSPTGSFWFSDNGTGVSDLLVGAGRPQPLV